MAAELQAITFREYLPALLGGTEHIPPYKGYNESVNVGMSNIMATAAFRLGHYTTICQGTNNVQNNDLKWLRHEENISKKLMHF